MTTEKFTLTTEEVKKYNELKLKIRRARTRLEVSLYTKQAQDILDKGRNRYVNRLEQKKAEVKSKEPVKGKVAHAAKIIGRQPVETYAEIISEMSLDEFKQYSQLFKAEHGVSTVKSPDKKKVRVQLKRDPKLSR